MNKTCTLEQAKRLKELGIEQESEKYWMESPTGDWAPCEIIHPIFEYKEPYYAAFDTDELMAMMPDGLTVGKRRGKYHVFFIGKNNNQESTGFFDKSPSLAIAELLCDNIRASTPGFELVNINERIKQYNNA